MNIEQFNMEKLRQGCAKLGIEISEPQQQKLLGHIALVEKWNKRLNLTAITQGDEMIVNHILDSLSILDYLKGDRLLDIGTGAGFPGIPLAIVRPDLNVTLLDSRGKRIEFLRFACNNLGLPQVSLEKSRVEDYRPVQKFDTLTARAFSSLDDLVKLTENFRKPDMRLIALKGKHPKDEIAQLNNVIRSQIVIHEVEVPFLAAQRHVVIIDT